MVAECLRPPPTSPAARRGLLVAHTRDTPQNCFAAAGHNAGWLREKLGDRQPNTSGAIVDESGAELGRHEGTVAFTIGQRRGLRLGHPAADGKPRFVLDIEPVSGTVTVGPRDHLAVRHVSGIKPRWCGAAPASLDGTVQLRAHGNEHPCRVTVGETVEIELLEPAYGIAPGQAAVLYDGTRVVGSATIASTQRVAAER
jgi:tRNA-specific 2-thiouridylase